MKPVSVPLDPDITPELHDVMGVLVDNLTESILRMHLSVGMERGQHSGAIDRLSVILRDLGEDSDRYVRSAEEEAQKLLATSEATSFLERRERMAVVVSHGVR